MVGNLLCFCQGYNKKIDGLHLILGVNMDIIREADVVWQGSVKEGKGKVTFGSKAFEGEFSLKQRIGEAKSKQTNPEELIAAAHASCFSMALSGELTKAGSPPDTITTKAKVHFGPEGAGFGISLIELETQGKVPGIAADKFVELAEAAKKNCPISKALAAVKITLKAKLV